VARSATLISTSLAAVASAVSTAAGSADEPAGMTTVCAFSALANSSTCFCAAASASSFSTRYATRPIVPIDARMVAISSAVSFESSRFEMVRPTGCPLCPSTKLTIAASARTTESRRERPSIRTPSFQRVRRSSPTSVRVRQVTLSSASGARWNAGCPCGNCCARTSGAAAIATHVITPPRMK
jgi:hypothetical protein